MFFPNNPTSAVVIAIINLVIIIVDVFHNYCHLIQS